MQLERGRQAEIDAHDQLSCYFGFLGQLNRNPRRCHAAASRPHHQVERLDGLRGGRPRHVRERRGDGECERPGGAAPPRAGVRVSEGRGVCM